MEEKDIELLEWYEKDKQNKKKYRENNKEEINKKARELHLINKDEINKRRRELYKINKNKEKKQEYYKKNKQHILELRHKEKLRTKHNHLVKRYGITIEQYENMLDIQKSKCYICDTFVDNTKNNYLHVDHNHTTGKVRKLLCMGCNASLGLIKENKNTLLKMIEYLKEHE